MLKVSGNAVCQVSLEVCPDKFIRVELRRISREVKGFDPWMVFKESSDALGSVNRASVPKEEDQSPEMPMKKSEELLNLLGSDVLADMETCAEPEASSLGRDGNRGDSRDFAPASGDNELRRSSLGCPGLPDIGDKRKPALIQEYQAGSKLSGLFLYEAKRAASSNGWIAPGAPWLFSEAFDNSIQGCSSNTKDLRGNSLSGSSSKRLCRYVSRSRDPLSNRLPVVLSPGCASEPPSAVLTEENAAPDELGASVQKTRLSDNPVANALRSLKKLPVSRPRRGRYALASKGARPGVAVVRVSSGCHEVS